MNAPTACSLALALVIGACAIDSTPAEGVATQASTSDNMVTLHGGTLIAHPKVVAVWWGPKVAFQSELSAFYAAWMPSYYFDWLAEYDTGGQTIGRGSFAGAIQITPSITSFNVTPREVEDELRAQIASGVLPPQDANTIYAVHFSGYNELADGISFPCAAAGRLETASYTIVGDASTSQSHCTAGPGAWAPSYYYGFDPTVTFTVSAMLWAITDPFTPTGLYSDATGTGIVEVCEAMGNPVMLSFGGTSYAMPRMWSNAHHACYAPVWSSDFALPTTPLLTIASGATVSVPMPISISYGASIPVSLAVSAGPDLSAHLASTSVASGTSTTMPVTVAPTAENGTSWITVVGTAEGHTWLDEIAVTIRGLVANGDFEEMTLAPWTKTGYAGTETSHVHDGSVAAIVGNAAAGPTYPAHTLSQVIAVPPTGTTTLSYWFQPMSNCAYTADRLQVRLLDATGTVVRSSLFDACTHLGWTQMTADLTPFAGATLTLQFRVQNSPYTNDYTFMYVDGVKMTWTAPSTPNTAI